MIEAKIIADSISPDGDRITTYELQYPRFIHSELMTHRLFSRNAASSRAIPVEKMIEQVQNNPAMPVHWGKNQPGMQAEEEFSGITKDIVIGLWADAADNAASLAASMNSVGAHKQLVNRILEPFQWMKTIVTATEYDNFFWLRCHADAQPEIKVLAEKMYEAMQGNTPSPLKYEDWHLPYVETYIPLGMCKAKYSVNGVSVSLEQALKVSASCCAQVSFRALDDGLEKAERIYDRLVNSVPVHASPFEHQAKPMEYANTDDSFYSEGNGVIEQGVTHTDTSGNYWSGNFKGWIQYRQLIDNNVCWDYNE